MVVCEILHLLILLILDAPGQHSVYDVFQTRIDSGLCRIFSNICSW